MREILFRGKMKGKWIEGSLVRFPDGTTEICYSGEKCDIDELDRATVATETVGQFTGLNDKNGKRIFEGDIVRAHFRTNHRKQTFCVIFEDGMFLFDNNCVDVPKYDIYGMEIIGNIHDNPELMREA